MHRLSIVVMGVLLVGALAAPAVAFADSNSAAVGDASAYTPPPISFGDCTPGNSGGSASTLQFFGAQCGYVTVPLNYANPNGQKIKLAVSRVMHTTSNANYKGIMLVNPGGPGGSGLVYSVLPQAFGMPDNAGDGYDWIGWDPRGVGSSIPSLSCDPSFFETDRPAYRPTTDEIMADWVGRSKAYAKSCTHAAGAALFNHVTTLDSVKDMESIRRALGATKMNFYGFSYGTYLGSVYMTLHPDRVGRFVLDSTVDPRGVWFQDNRHQDMAFQKTFDAYFTWLAKYSSVYHVGATHDAVRDEFLNIETQLNVHPAANGQLGGDELLDVFTSAAYYVYGWEDIASAYSKYVHTGNANALLQMYTDANPTTAGGDNSYAMYLATQCTDTGWPQSQTRLNRNNWRLDATYNYFTWANAWFNGPCPYWQYPHDQPVHVNGAAVNAPVLMIDETLDPATPYEGSLYVRSIFPTASLIEGKDGTTHAGSLSGVACTDNTIANYLLTGQVPARKAGDRSDKVCPPVPQPNPTPSSVSPLLNQRYLPQFAQIGR